MNIYLEPQYFCSAYDTPQRKKSLGDCYLNGLHEAFPAHDLMTAGCCLHCCLCMYANNALRTKKEIYNNFLFSYMILVPLLLDMSLIQVHFLQVYWVVYPGKRKQNISDIIKCGLLHWPTFQMLKSLLKMNII